MSFSSQFIYASNDFDMTSPMTPEELPPGGVMDPSPARRRGVNSAAGRAGFNLRERRTTTVERETKVTPETGVDFQGKGEGKADPSSTAPEGEAEDASTSKKTYGRTPDGTVFLVPQTHDMVTQLLSPTSPKNYSDLLVLTILTLHVLFLTYLPPPLRIPVFAAVFLFWRAAYNVGIGILLHNQSTHGRLVLLARKYKIFENPSTGNQPRPRLYAFLKRELETKIPADYNFDDAPLEYNTWLVFRRIVDLILMCDFTSYCLFAIACFTRPPTESYPLFFARWGLGIALVLFNAWVKLDAHRVVKDYAWYWGDFFYLIDQELTFDGVFEMAPHPMYSVGYAGYYGISLMAASYKVLGISVLAHAAQFAFLVWVENPHIEKTYNSPAPRRKGSVSSGCSNVSSVGGTVDGDASALMRKEYETAGEKSVFTPPPPPASIHNLLGFHNFDIYRITDSSVLLINVLFFLLTALTPSTPTYRFFFVLNAALWRIWLSVGLGYVLHKQSTAKLWTRHFLKYGEDRNEAWRQWKGAYHLSLTLACHAFIAASWKMYARPASWDDGFTLLRHVVGASLVALHVWTSVSIYDSLGEFGWFFGDFFFDENPPKLTYNGIYRFLNNPERFLGLAGVWGAALITNNAWVIGLAVLSHVLALAFIQFVERPHMQKLYGRTGNLRRDAGLVRSLKKTLPPSITRLRTDVDKILDDSFEFVEEFLEHARPRLSAGVVTTLVKDTTALFQKYPARITISRLEPGLAGYDVKDYSVSIVEPDLDSSVSSNDSHPDTLVLEYGAPIRVRWTAPLNHSKKDWIGMYLVTDNGSREVTSISSKGRWIPTNAANYDSIIADAGILSSDRLTPGTTRKDGETADFFAGEVVFQGDKLWWTQGVFEFRYHHNAKHNVMAISRPFEIRIARFRDEPVSEHPHPRLSGAYSSDAVEQALLPVIRNCLDRDPKIAPDTVVDVFGDGVFRDAKYAKRIVYAVEKMFGIEFAPEIVRADRCVRNLAWRVCNAKKVLAPYNLQVGAGGAETPESLE